jgi:mannosyltransferase
MTRLHLDDIIFALQPFGGISTYWRQLSSELESHPGLEVTHTAGTAMSRLFSVRCQSPVFHSSYFRIPSSSGTRCVVTVHDLAFEKGIVRSPTRCISLYQRAKAIKRADAIVCVSESTKHDLMEAYPHTRRHSLVRVIHHGCGSVSDRSLSSREDKGGSTIGLDVPFALFVGSRRGYKNFFETLAGFARSELKSCGKLVCIGEPLSSAETQWIRRLNLQHRVVVIADATSDQIHDYYRRAIVFLYPSAYEGFGLPIVEAMAFGCPVIASSASAVSEIAGDAALLLETVNAETIAAAINQALQPSVRSVLSRLGQENVTRFSWAASASAHADLYSLLAGS